MPTYYVHLVGEGYGCDYCISCNETMTKIEANDMEAAKKKVAKMIGEYSLPGIEKALIIEAAQAHDFDVKGWRQKQREAAARKKELEDKEKRRAEFEKLRREFEESPARPGFTRQDMLAEEG